VAQGLANPGFELIKLIRRAAEVEGEPNATRELITVDDPDLPKLPP
jgi:hypothetical protein